MTRIDWAEPQMQNPAQFAQALLQLPRDTYSQVCSPQEAAAKGFKSYVIVTQIADKSIKRECIGCVPRGMRILPPQERPIFRHYTHAHLLDTITRTEGLRAGAVAYVQKASMSILGAGSETVWSEVTGSFLTTAAHMPGKVGVEGLAYVDLTVDDSFPVLFLEDGIYVVPAIPGTRLNGIRVIGTGILEA